MIDGGTGDHPVSDLVDLGFFSKFSGVGEYACGKMVSAGFLAFWRQYLS
jgi:hypothetical protein